MEPARRRAGRSMGGCDARSPGNTGAVDAWRPCAVKTQLRVVALDCREHAMYIYIVQRTQIYLSKRETEALDRAARATGLTRSHLIREAIAQQYLRRPEAEQVLEALRETAGAWSGRTETGAAVVDRLRSGRLRRLHSGR